MSSENINSIVQILLTLSLSLYVYLKSKKEDEEKEPIQPVQKDIDTSGKTSL